MDRGAWWATVRGSQRVRHDLVPGHAHTQSGVCDKSHRFISQVVYILFIDQCIKLASYYNQWIRIVKKWFNKKFGKERFSYSKKKNDVFQNILLFIPLYTHEIIC